MKKSYMLVLRLETEVLDNLKKQAYEEGISLSEFVRRKLKQPSAIDNMKVMIEEMHKKLIKK